jgi:hypothetical protein
MSIAPLLTFVHPALADEMRLGLVADGAAGLVPEVARLRVLGPCGCGDDFCSSFYTGPRGAPVETLVLTPYSLMVDVWAGRFIFVEVLDRPDVRAVFAAAFGDAFFGARPRSRVCAGSPLGGRTRRR